MSVNPSNIVLYGSADMPETDGTTTGGSVDTSKRIEFSDITPPGTMDYVSSAAGDTATKIKLTGRDSTGAIQSETVTLNGQTTINGTQNFERLLYAAASGASANGPIANPGGTTATGTLAALSHAPLLVNRTPQSPYSANISGATPPLVYLQAGDGATCTIGTIIRIVSGTGIHQLCRVIDNTRYGTDVVAVNQNFTTPLDATSMYSVFEGMLFEIAPNQVTAVIRAFATAAAQGVGGSTVTYYEKIFVVNNNTSTSLTSSTLTIQSETPSLPGSAALDIAVTTALNDNATTTNRQMLPTNQGGGALTFTTGAPPQTQIVPTPGNLPSGAAPNAAGAQGIWLRLTLPAGTAPYKGSFDVRPTGTTT